jgi:uroporphyrinogen decarboxylase
VKELPQLYEKTGIDSFSVWDWPSVQPEYTGPVREGITEYDRSAAYGFWGKVGEIIYPLAGKELDEYRWPSAEDFDFSKLKAGLLEVRNMDMTTASGHAGAGWLHHVQMRGYDHALYDVMDDEWMNEYIQRNREFLIPYFEKLFENAGGLIDVIRADEDLGGHENMLISPELWRKWYKPLWREVFDICRRNGAKIWLHSCGYCRDVVPDFIEIGVDILNPLPPYVRGSDPVDMKRTFGSRLAFDGGVDQMNILVRGTPAEVREEVKRRMDQLAPGGGYIAGPSQVFSKDVPLENVIAFFEAALRYGNY